jgi:hypothetical protein
MLIVNEKPTWHASHWKITKDSIEAAMAKTIGLVQ